MQQDASDCSNLVISNAQLSVILSSNPESVGSFSRISTPNRDIPPEPERKIHWHNSIPSKQSALPPELTHEFRLPIKKKAVFTEIPHLLDGFKILNEACAEIPEHVYSANLSKKGLEYIIEEDLILFTKLQSLNVSENALPFARLGALPALKHLNFSCNGTKSIDLDADGKFKNLEVLDLSYNNIDHAAQIVLATLPNLKYLDLTRNNIKSIAETIKNLTDWRDRVIELVLPKQVAALGLGSNTQLSYTNDPMAQSLQKIIPDMIGFQSLESLVLENNPIGKSLSSLEVLSLLPNLHRLNMNRTGIENLSWLIPAQFSSLGFMDLFGLEKSLLPKYTGFKLLKEFYLVSNNINSLDNLCGVIFLSSLTHVYLQDNPVVRTFKPVHMQTKKRNHKGLHFNDIEFFDLFGFLIKKYQISIGDPCFAPPHPIGVGLLNKDKRLRSGNSKKVARKGTRQFLHNKVTVSLGHMADPLVVQDLPPIKATDIQAKKEKRIYKFTDEDLKYIVQTGKIPTIKSLIEYANTKEQPSVVEPLKEIVTESAVKKQIDIHYDPNQVDQTFITGVHITDNRQKKIKETKKPFHFEFSEPITDDTSLPPTMLASVRYLRQILKNPGLVWRTSQQLLQSKPLIDHSNHPSLPRNEVQDNKERFCRSSGAKRSHAKN